MSRIRVLIKNPGEKARLWNIENELETLQYIVGGYIETLTVSDTLVMIFNEEGKMKDLPFNFYLYGGEDFVVGPCIFAGRNYKGELVDIDKHQLHMLSKHLGVEEMAATTLEVLND